MTPRSRAAWLLCGASLLISTAAVRSTRADRGETAVPGNVVIEAQAGNYVGMNGCASSQCHTRVREWALKLDGDGKANGKQHVNALSQLDERKFPDVKKYLGAVNAKDAYEEQTCRDCHTTPDGTGDIEGVTCESCHGAGKRYREPHQAKGTGVAPYVSLGMKDYKKSPGEWVPLCTKCHILGSSAKHKSLVDAGHPSGADFNVATAAMKVQGPPNSHWASRNYKPADIAPFAPAKPRPAAAPVTPTPAPAAAPVSPTPAPPAPPKPGPPTPGPATAVPRPAPTPGPRTAVTPTPTPVVNIVPPVPPVVRPVTPRPAPPDPAPMPAAIATPAPAPAPAPPVGITSAEPRTMSGLIASVQGRLINVLASLLRQNATVPQRVVPPAKPAVYSGPDRDLLKLQDDIISLALEVLGKAPGKSGGSQ